MSVKITLEETKNRIDSKYSGLVVLNDLSYIGFNKRAHFVHALYGVFISTPKAVCLGHLPIEFKGKEMSLTIQEVKDRLINSHTNVVTIKEETYINSSTEAIFVDKDYGEWPGLPFQIIRGSGHPKRASNNHRISLREVKKRLSEVHGNMISIVNHTYKKVAEEALFIDPEFGEFSSIVNSVLHGVGHPLRGRLNGIKKLNNSSIRHHWKTGEELVCQASYETKTVDYLNNNKIDFLWQPKIFKMPTGKTYRPDFYLVDSDVWVEIKGYFRKDAQIKWDWFKSERPTAELWNEKKLKEMGIL